MAGRNDRSLFLTVGADVSPLQAEMRKGQTVLLDLVTSAETMQDGVSEALRNIKADPNGLKSLVDTYRNSFYEIRRNAQQVLDAPAPQAAVSIINRAGAEEAAEAAERKAAGSRLVAEAALKATGANDNETASLRAFAQGAIQATVALEEQAVALRSQAGLLALVENELGVAGDAAVRVGGKVEGSHARMGASGLILQHVVRSTSDSFAAGLPPTMIFAEQIGRLGEAAALSGGSMGKFGEVMSGPWGLAISAGISLAVTLAGSLIHASEASEQQKAATEALAASLHRLAGAEAEADHATRAGISADIAKTAALRDREIQNRRTLISSLESAKADAAKSFTAVAGGEGAEVGQGIASQNVSNLTREIALQQKEIDKATRAIGGGAGKIALLDVAAATDKATAATQRYDETVHRLQTRFERGAFGDPLGKGARDKLAALETAAKRIEQADIEAARDEKKTGRTRKPKVDHTAEREAAAAAREAAAAQRELDQAYSQVVGKLDPTTAALNEYRDVLAKIDALLRNGRISVGDALRYDHAALVQEQTRQATQAAAQAKSILGTEGDDFIKGAVASGIENSRGVNEQRERDNAKAEKDPLMQYRKQVDDATGDMNTALHQVEADGLRGLESGLMSALDGTKSLAGAFGDMAKSILADLEKIAVEKAIVAGLDAIFPGAGQLFKGVTGKKDGGIVTSIPGYANGGAINAAGICTGGGETIIT